MWYTFWGLAEFKKNNNLFTTDIFKIQAIGVQFYLYRQMN